MSSLALHFEQFSQFAQINFNHFIYKEVHKGKKTVTQCTPEYQTKFSMVFSQYEYRKGLKLYT
jgi:hypothetical protein